MVPIDQDIPADFFCPITGEIMHEPLMSRYGANFERSAIVHWLQYHNSTCPLTRHTLGPRDLVPNAALKLRIRAFCNVNKIDHTHSKDTTEGDLSNWMLTAAVETLTKSKNSTPAVDPVEGRNEGVSRKKRSFLSRIAKLRSRSVAPSSRR